MVVCGKDWASTREIAAEIFNMNQCWQHHSIHESTGHEIIMRLCDPLRLASLRGGVPLPVGYSTQTAIEGGVSEELPILSASATSNVTECPKGCTTTAETRPVHVNVHLYTTGVGHMQKHSQQVGCPATVLQRPRACTCSLQLQLQRPMSRHSRGGAQPNANPRFRHPKRRMRFRLLKLHCSCLPPFLHDKSSPGKIPIHQLHAHHAILNTSRGRSTIRCQSLRFRCAAAN